MAVWDCGELLWTAATFLAWASLVALGIAWDAHVKFRLLLDTVRLTSGTCRLSGSGAAVAGGASGW